QDEVGTDARYYGKLSYNKFSIKNKFSLIGLANNTNEQGFTFQDISSFSGGMQNVWDNNFFGNSDAGSLNGNTKGISDNLTGGMNLNNSSVKNLELNVNYIYSYTNNLLNQHSLKNYIGAENNFNSSTDSKQQLFNHNQRANLKAVYKFSENSNLTLKSNMNYTTADKNVFSTQENYVIVNNPINSSISDSKTNSDGINIRNNLIFKQKFKKVGRTFVFDGSYNWRGAKSDANLNSSQSYLDTASLLVSKLILQNQLSDNPRNTLALKFTYTEPLTTESVLEFGYVHQNSLNGTKKSFYDLTPNSEIKTLNDSLSSDYSNQYSFDKGGLKIRYNKGNTNFAIGATVQNSLLNGTSQKSDQPIKKTFLKTLPSLSLVQKFDHAGRMNLFYQARVNEPSIDQLQPVIDNTNPLAVYKGNPNLDAEYSHTLNLNYNYFSQYSSTSFFVYTYSSYATKHIINAVTYDSLLVQTTQPVNSKYQFFTSVYLSFSTPIKFLGVKIGLEPGGEYTDGLIFINGKQTGTKTYSSDLGWSL
ncbi:MAG: outer membrane beta-barrel protein, partial [Bacteroidota bacterium]